MDGATGIVGLEVELRAGLLMESLFPSIAPELAAAKLAVFLRAAIFWCCIFNALALRELFVAVIGATPETLTPICSSLYSRVGLLKVALAVAIVLKSIGFICFVKDPREVPIIC